MDVWTMSLESREWMQLDTGSGPHERHWLSAIHDPVRDWVVIFGGFTEFRETQVFGDTWAFSLETNSWVQLDMGGADAPHRRYGHSAIFDPVGYRMIIYGGFDDVSNATVNDVWAFHLDDFSWEQLRTGRHGELPIQPTGRRHQTAVYDAFEHQMIIFGGSDGDGRRQDTWAFDLGPSGETAHTWMQLAAGPQSRANHVAVFEDARGRMIIHGGNVDDLSRPRVGDIWAYDRASDMWTQMRETHIEGDPAGRDQHVAVYDPMEGALIVYGGWTPTIVDDCWSYCLD